jgi:hypothetical protein
VSRVQRADILVCKSVTADENVGVKGRADENVGKSRNADIVVGATSFPTSRILAEA